MSFSIKSPSSSSLKSEPQYPESSFRYMAEFSLRSPFSNPQNSCLLMHASFYVPSFTAFRRPGMGRMPKGRGLSTHYEEATNHPIFSPTPPCFAKSFLSLWGRATKIAERRWWEMLSCEAELAMESYMVEKL